MNKKIKITLIVVVVLVILGILKTVFVLNYTPNYYSGVYMNTGEVYIGKLSHFPMVPMTLSDAYLVQAGKEEGTIDLLPLSSIPWGPEKLELSGENVIFFGRVGEGSPVWEALGELDN